MPLYEVEATRWYFSEVFYRVVAESYREAMDKVSTNDQNVQEVRTSSPTWNGEEEILDSKIIKTVHLMSLNDNPEYLHTNCQYIGSNKWDCGHVSLPEDGYEWRQLPLIEGHEASSGTSQSWIMWFEKWADSLDEDAYAEAREQYEASKENENV